LRSDGEVASTSRLDKYAPLYQDLVKFRDRDGQSVSMRIIVLNWASRTALPPHQTSFALRDFRLGTGSSNDIVALPCSA